ncbi:thioredoxin family protein [Sulfuricella denitrificans]|uniref:thioredoxin family protein n=1 Tax=Sulfuricella denitrificans TaxID=649841 RepID=UPI001378A96A|nr:thioredoxin family protein [Sulfuricella denitrificans]
MKFTNLTEFDFYPRLAQSPGSSLVLFSGPHCGTCRKAEAVLPQALAGWVDRLYKVDVEKSIALAREYEIFHLPALILFVDGHFHAWIHSPLLPEMLQQVVEKALILPAEEAP